MHTLRFMHAHALRSIRCALAVLLVSLAAHPSHAQNGGSIFVTPYPGSPFTATVRVVRTDLVANGTTRVLWSQRQIARDSTSRIYNEFRPFVPETNDQVPPIGSIHLYDPQNRMSEMLYPQRKTYQMSILLRPPSTDVPDDYASTTALSAQPSQYTRQEDLGDHEINGLQAHGVRITQTLPAAMSGTGKEATVVNEYWYAAALRLNLLVKHSDSRSGSLTTTVTGINRTEPSADLFGVPADYLFVGQAR